MSLPDLIGLIGAGAYLGAYALLQMGRLSVRDGRYALLNVIGALALISSLFWQWNLGAFVSQGAWLLFTVVGFLRNAAPPRRAA
ncbi:CBU_0592 family membrane protein [Sinirhodobacter huangdaonensis]|jgi:hypothetical protein|uniref:Cyclic nucleotide-binding protein n=1 Tax=Paenirhodobacter huangdaonensis TaxID=2501515 RepID=A0A3S3MSZ8_9RHOB|nr:cyclic nucleotide-binding protein [Sinirhodobacter huangdaonensis]RWR54643.1 cyclic nucleotide-binding protein [Sinirhodobacter huangdaonensis]